MSEYKIDIEAEIIYGDTLNVVLKNSPMKLCLTNECKHNFKLFWHLICTKKLNGECEFQTTLGNPAILNGVNNDEE